ncbi:MAG: TonB-dependent receptor [Acidobacteriota bacterium]|nr:TonB-dependent receptor [Acidobacteriota bacterium]
MKKGRNILLTFVSLALLLSLTTAVKAQVINAGVNGTVTDATGKVVQNATVTVTNVGTNATRTITTDEAGFYNVTELQPGMYTVTVEATGFNRTIVRDLELNVGAQPTVNVELRPGQVTETVEVTSDANIVETTRSEIGQSITRREIENLPLLNRTFAGLTVVAPEARPVGNFDPTKTRVGNIAFSGGDGRQVNVNVDGGDNKDNVVGSLLQNFSYESIQEFQVVQHRWTADQGRSVGGVVNVITKSGTNSLRGSAFFNYRGEELRALDFFDKQAINGHPAYNIAPNPNYKKPYFARQEFGGSIGGPIIKDKTFYFFALERFRERQNVAVLGSVVADLQAIPGNAFVPEIPQPYDDTLLTAKVDHRLNDAQNLFLRYSYQGSDSPNDQVGNPARTDLSGGNSTINRLHSFVANHTFNVSSNAVNTFIFHFQDFKNEILPNKEGLTLNFPGGISIGQNANTPQATLERKYQFRDDFNLISGNHTMKFGVNYIHTQLDGYFYFGTRGYSLTFNQSPTAIKALPLGFATPGLLQSLTYSDGASSHKQKIDQLAFYGQDDWKVTPNLTLNLGLRWDANIGNLPRQDQNRTILLLSQLNHPLAKALTQDQEKLRRTTPSWTEFQPRLGFAWDPRGRGETVIRGGYGIFYDQLFQNLTLFSQTQSEPQIFQTAINLQGAELAAFRYGTDQLPQVPANFNFGVLTPGAVGRINDPDATEPYVQKFSIGFQHQISSTMTISSDFVHTLGLHEPRFLNINPTIQRTCNPAYPGALQTNNPAYAATCPRGVNTRRFDAAFQAAGLGLNRLSQINMFSTNNRSMFDSWTTTFKYRKSNILFNASYVLASSRAWGGQPTASYSGNGIAITPEQQFAEGEFGPTRMDERHRIVLSGVIGLPYGFQLSPILQYGSPRPFSANTGFDIDGDGLATIDRLCEGVSPAAAFAVRGNLAQLQALNPLGCQQAPVNSLRSGYVWNGTEFEERSHRFFNVDLRISKIFRFGERFRLSLNADLFNLFNTENLAFGSNARLGLSVANNAQTFLQPTSLYGPGFGPPIGRPFTAQFGARFTF